MRLASREVRGILLTADPAACGSSALCAGRQSGPGPAATTTIATRRLSARPSGVSFDATGCSKPQRLALDRRHPGTRCRQTRARRPPPAAATARRCSRGFPGCRCDLRSGCARCRPRAAALAICAIARFGSGLSSSLSTSKRIGTARFSVQPFVGLDEAERAERRDAARRAGPAPASGIRRAMPTRHPAAIERASRGAAHRVRGARVLRSALQSDSCSRLDTSVRLEIRLLRILDRLPVRGRPRAPLPSASGRRLAGAASWTGTWRGPPC